MRYRREHCETVIYGSTLKIRDIYSQGSQLFVAEMNNQTNKIEGIGLIKNCLTYDKRHNIYDNDDYNRYIYKGNYWLSRKQINQYNPEILEILDTVLFKGRSHLKCRIGITIITPKLFVHWDYDLDILKKMVKNLFLDYFKYKLELLEEKEEEYFEIVIPKIEKGKRKGKIEKAI
jgi:hypothetical protein